MPSKPDVTLRQLDAAAQNCRGCDLYKNATQAVFGELASHIKSAAGLKIVHAPMMLVGEQPGDQEDLQGRPFVGPAGKLLDRALAEAGIDRSKVYVTNAVKHFKWTPGPRGKKRLHSKPNTGQIRACRPWLEREIMLVKPDVVVCLGATAAATLLGPAFRVTTMRGQIAPPADWAAAIAPHARFTATVHPSSILRAPDHDGREREYRAMVADLKKAKSLLT